MMEDSHFKVFLLQVNYTKYIQNILLYTNKYKISTSIYILQIEQNISLVHTYLMRYTHVHLAQKPTM
jgi:hypothetical protein